MSTNVSDKNISSIFRVEEQVKQETCINQRLGKNVEARGHIPFYALNKHLPEETVKHIKTACFLVEMGTQNTKL
jgi:hypothetical protein